MRKNKLFLLLLTICAVLCFYLIVELTYTPAEIPLKETDLYGTWYCEEYDNCIRVDEVETQFLYLISPIPYEDSAPKIDGSTVVWCETIGTYSYVKEEETEKLVCISSRNAKVGTEFIKTKPIVQLEDIYNTYYSDTYKCVGIGSQRAGLKLHTGSAGMEFYSGTNSCFIVGDKLFLGGECFRINMEGKYIHLEHSDHFDILEEKPELYDVLVEVFVPWEELDWYQYHDSDIWGEWTGIETGNTLCVYEDYYEITLSTGEVIKRANWEVENDAIVIPESLAFHIQEVEGQMRLVTGDFPATIEADIYVKVKPQ